MIDRVRRSLLLTALALFSVIPLRTANAEVTFDSANGQLSLQMPQWSLRLDQRSGALLALQDKSGKGTLLRGGPNLWTIVRLEQDEVHAVDCSMEFQWDAAAHTLHLRYASPAAQVHLACLADAAGPVWNASVQMKQGKMLEWRFPENVEFAVEPMRQFIFPDNIGLAFTKAFFEPGGGGYGSHYLHGDGMRKLMGIRCEMRPVDDPSVPLKTGKHGEPWLPQWYLNEMKDWRVPSNRIPATPPDASIVESEHGSWLTGHQLGGWGWLFRFGGILGDHESRPISASVFATLMRLYELPPERLSDAKVPGPLAGKPRNAWRNPPKKVGFIFAPPTNRPGVRLRPDPSQLMREMERLPWSRRAGFEYFALDTPKQIRAALAKPREWFTIVSTIGEGFPAESPEHADSMLKAIADYVRNGGIWWEAGGGYSFYRAIVPKKDAAFVSANRAFCDFVALDSASGRLSLFGVQRPGSIYVPSQSEIAATDADGVRIGRYTHQFTAYADQSKPSDLPALKMVVGMPHRDVLKIYASDNHFEKGLTDKADPALVEKLKRYILMKVSTGSLQRTTEVAENLQHPVLFHITEYLKGGFDKQYPDHLPPNPQVGTADDLKQLLATCRKREHLFMPYTNPTWWCDNPKGPTFERDGDVALSRGFDGKIYPESYGLRTVQGYAICAWHPFVRRANDVIRQQFTAEYPVDVLFQDQVGARGHRWDTNSAAPHAGAYLEGIHRIAHVDSKTVPLGTEDGQDRLINYETMFCGLSGPWLPNRPDRGRILYEQLWPTESWRHEPLAIFLAHDKVLFYHHDLGGFVRNLRDISHTLVMGFNLSWWTHSTKPSDEEVQWIDRLCRLQAAIGPHCVGRALDDFEYLAPDVIRSTWGDLTITANLATKPWRVDERTEIAVDGFLAHAPGLTVGVFSKYEGKKATGEPFWVLKER